MLLLHLTFQSHSTRPVDDLPSFTNNNNNRNNNNNNNNNNNKLDFDALSQKYDKNEAKRDKLKEIEVVLYFGVVFVDIVVCQCCCMLVLVWKVDVVCWWCILIYQLVFFYIGDVLCFCM